MLFFIAKKLGKESISEKDIEYHTKIADQLNDNGSEYKSHAEVVVSKIESFQKFFEEWKSHFVETMKPKHMPKNWEIERDSHGRKR